MFSVPEDLPDLKSHTGRFLFYPFVMSHAEPLADIIGMEASWTQGYLDGARMPENSHDAQALIAVWMLPNPTYTILTNDRERRVIGALNIVESNHDQGFARLGNLIVHPDYWWIDLRLEFFSTMIDFLLAQGAARIEAREAVNNGPALELLDRLGFEEEGVRRNSLQRHDGTWEDRVVLSLIPEDWSKRRASVYSKIDERKGELPHPL